MWWCNENAQANKYFIAASRLIRQQCLFPALNQEMSRSLHRSSSVSLFHCHHCSSTAEDCCRQSDIYVTWFLNLILDSLSLLPLHFFTFTLYDTLIGYGNFSTSLKFENHCKGLLFVCLFLFFNFLRFRSGVFQFKMQILRCHDEHYVSLCIQPEYNNSTEWSFFLYL